MANFSQQKTSSEVIQKISLIRVKALSKNIRNITNEKKTIQLHSIYSHMEKNITKIFKEKVLLI